MHHPKEIIQPELIEDIRKYAAKTEAALELPKEILEIIYRQKWFQVLVPKVCGGLEYTLPEAVRLFEALAYAEANMGWCVNLGAGANMFAGYLDADVSKAIFNSAQTCCAGSGAVSGNAFQTDGGYHVTGHWKYASGANHATHFTANAFLFDIDKNPVLKDGVHHFLSFIIPANQIYNHKNWNAIGLKATTSNDFEATEVFVRHENTFSLLKPSPFANGPVYQFPFDLLAAVNMTCMITGIALHFMESYEELAASKKPLHSNILLKDNAIAQGIHQEVHELFHHSRNEMYRILEQIWHKYEIKAEVTDNEKLQLKQATHRATISSRRVIEQLFPLCGISIVAPEHAMNKIWRDAAVAGQHYLMSPLHMA